MDIKDGNKRGIEYKPLTELLGCLHPQNPKQHDLGAIIESYKTHGFVASGVLDERTGLFLAGHGRIQALAAMKRQHMDTPDGIRNGGDDWHVPVQVGYASKNDVQALAYLAADNKLTIDGGWDEPALADLLQEIANSTEVALESTGFSGDELDELLRDLGMVDEPPEDPGAQVDRAAELNKKWGVVRGDVWQVGKHRVMCGDSTSAEDVGLLMGGVKAGLCHADPPYGMGKEKDGILNDNLYREKLDNFQIAWWNTCREHLEYNASAYVWGNAEDLWRLWYCGGLRDSERLTVRNEIVWDKGNGEGMLSDAHRMFPTASERCLFFMLGEQHMSTNADNYWEGWDIIKTYLEDQVLLMGWKRKDINNLLGTASNGGGMASHFLSGSQFCLPTSEMYEKMKTSANGKAFKREYDDIKREYDDIKREWDLTRAYFDNTHDNMTDVWQYSRVLGADRWEHATPKPVEMIQRIIKSSSRLDGVVYEPFLGSGTTLVACEQTGRVGYGMEISPDYVAVCLERLAGMGLQPERVNANKAE